MKHYLVFTIEPYRLMVEAPQVHELVVGREGGRACGGGHMVWRGRMVPTVELAALLGRSPPKGAGRVSLIYGDPDGESSAGGGVVSFEVDRVVGLRVIGDSEMRFLPPLASALAPMLMRLFGGMVLDPADGKGILWLRVRAGTLLALAREHRRAALVPDPVPVGSGCS